MVRRQFDIREMVGLHGELSDPDEGRRVLGCDDKAIVTSRSQISGLVDFGELFLVTPLLYPPYRLPCSVME